MAFSLLDMHRTSPVRSGSDASFIAPESPADMAGGID